MTSLSSPSASWIWSREDGPADTWLCFRTMVELETLPGSVPATIAADSTYWLWINGRHVVMAGGLKRGPTPSDTYCDAADLAPYLKRGSNTIAALVWFWGADGSSHINSGQGGFLLATSIPSLCTGPQWQLRRHPAFGHGQPRPPLGVRPEYPVIFDARSDLSGWKEQDYDASGWEEATVKGLPPTKPWGRLIPRPIPFFRYSEPRTYQNSTELSLPRNGPVELIAELPSNIQIYPRIQIDASAGKEITIQPEHSYEGVTYITRDGEQSFEVPTWGNGHFVTYSIPAGVRVLNLDYRETGYEADIMGEFLCDDPTLETLWHKCARSAYVNLRDSYMDCPDRERSPWPGDMANISATVAIVLDRRADAITTKGLREFLNWQTPDGVLWGAVPSGRFRDAYREFPAQSLALIATGFPNYVEQTADRTLAAEAVPRIRRYLLDCWHMNTDGLPNPRPFQAGWSAGTCDWMDWGEQIDRKLLETAWYAWALAGLESITHTAGLPADPAAADRRRSIAAAFDREFWDETVHAYRSRDFKDEPDDRANGIAVCAKLAPEQRHASLIQLLSQREAASIYMERYVVDALFILGSSDAALARLKRRYAACIASPHSTLPEDFATTGLQTNHGWGSWPAATIAQRIAGVRPIEPGYKAFVVEPCPAGLARFELRFPSIRGDIAVQWKKSDVKTTLKINCPCGSTAQVVLPPTRKWTSISCNGIAAWPKTATTCLAIVTDDSPRFRVHEGEWIFEAQ